MSGFRVIFLAGGLGNIFYQINYAHHYFDGSFKCSLLFYNRFIMKLFNYTQPLSDDVKLKGSLNNLWSLPVFLIFIFDLLLYKLFGFTIFTYLDTKNNKFYKPIFKIILFGYFQNSIFPPPLRIGLSEIAPGLCCNIIKEQCSDYDCIHFRYGDFMIAHREENKLHTNMPEPKNEWFNLSIPMLHSKTNSKKLVIVTDNLEGARGFFKNTDFLPYNEVKYMSGSLLEDVSTIINSVGIINYNSTFSLMLAETSSTIEHAILSDYLSQKTITENLRKKVVYI